VAFYGTRGIADADLYAEQMERFGKVMDNWREWRKQRRAKLMALREAVPENDYYCWNTAITESLKGGFPWLQRISVGFCWPHRGEYDPRPMMDFILRRGGVVALPEVVSKHEPLKFRQWWSEAPMKTGAYGIPVPDNTPLVSVEAMIIPMVGFDQRGFRLGYGSGYFDRTLVSSIPRPVAIGVAFEIARLADLHPQPHDIPMDFIVTEAGIYRTAGNGLAQLSVEECTAVNYPN
jgi:5,10-methenyltetrahydrofolate synthetase